MTARATNKKSDANARDEADCLNRELRRNLLLETAVIAFAIGALTILSIALVFYGYVTHSDALFALGLYVLTVHFAFHMSEFLTAAYQRPHDTHPDAFVIFHSKEYLTASALALLEFFIEAYAVPESWKLSPSRHPLLGAVLRINRTGAVLFTALVVFFYGIRVVAMLQCGSNFSLIIESDRRSSHRLVRHGLYRYLRHPSYFGWFWRSLFAQLVLANPLSAVVHTVVSWYFFRSRVAYEEATLEREDYFGEEYKAYKRRTYIGIPFCA
ncbi:putative prenyl protein specific carboxyl methyltransferase [Leptomonas pyrrhocoris]|uniref:Protein-S-isoprenylcysteine O-methyltransferase n=1 Tax=Leptomonas pyrrhocoris TaxID=157538 RepID=A0A0M9GAX5_LEPPY|nr:putative prenyl protein specific carboxyl methyltransferase [Leptomonas pyrrhocoris]KPA86316.1 putative prenyl protein specific carboxyl methyltransferase [Leptomonas pyrrhocoris]|eukprot:XP_015664755.1 putative prenyl protein specific carboxyl methyltransferase [Leptomonas pyrrhocoris]